MLRTYADDSNFQLVRRGLWDCIVHTDQYRFFHEDVGPRSGDAPSQLKMLNAKSMDR